jgi:hypothetical protein
MSSMRSPRSPMSRSPRSRSPRRSPQKPQHLHSPGKSYFDVEGDKELSISHSMSSSGDRPSPITWRGDPNDTYSDWTIVVVTNELQTASYHVHKSIVCFGPRQSKFFAKSVLENQREIRKLKQRSHGKAGYHESTSIKVELDDRDAANFPLLLDFIYAPCTNGMLPNDGTLTTAASSLSATLSTGVSASLGSFMTASMDEAESSQPSEEDLIRTKNALSLRYLAKRFEVETFILAVNKFIQRDLNFKTGPFYLTKAWIYKDDRLAQSAQKLCAENFEQLDVRALMKLPSNLFRVVVKALESFEDDNEQLSMFLSEVVCRYFEKNPAVLSASFLLELTDPLLMPYISPEASIGYTALTKDLEPRDAKQHWGGLVGLCRRCAKSVVQEYGWSDFSVNDAAQEYLEIPNPQAQVSIDSLLFATSFAAALEQAQNDYEDIMQEQETLGETVSAMNETMSLMERMNETKDKHLIRQQNAIESATQEILALKQQIADIRNDQQQQQQVHEEQQEQQVHQQQQQQAHQQQQVHHQQLHQQQQQVQVYHHQQEQQQVRKAEQRQITTRQEQEFYSIPDLPHEFCSGGDSHSIMTPTGADIMSPEDIVRDLISPSLVEGSIMAARREKQNRQPSREEMRAAKSLLN